MKFPLMRNNILREDLDHVIEHLKQDDPILTNGPLVRKNENGQICALKSPMEQSHPLANGGVYLVHPRALKGIYPSAGTAL